MRLAVDIATIAAAGVAVGAALVTAMKGLRRWFRTAVEDVVHDLEEDA